MKITIVAAAATLLVSAPAPARALDPVYLACPGYMQLMGYYRKEKAYIDSEVAILRRMSEAELQVERGRICGAANKTTLLEQNMYGQLQVCRDHGVPGMSAKTAEMATAILDAHRKAKILGCE